MLSVKQKHVRNLFCKSLFVFFLSSWLVVPGFGQYKILEDQAATDKIGVAINDIYNMNFAAADTVILELEQKLGDYPGIYLLKAFYLNWKYQPLKKDSEPYARFEEYLQQGIAGSEKILAKDDDNAEANFFMMACHAYLAQLYVGNGQNLKALGEAKTAYKYIKIGFDLVERYPEFYFSSGIYNYYREKYPEENPFYKPFVWFFRSGDKAAGLRMLSKGAEEAVFTRAECITYLYHINLHYENKPAVAFQYATILKNLYPNNLFYIASYVECSMQLQRYAEMKPFIDKLQQSEKPFYRYIGEIFAGAYLNHQLHDMTGAMLHFNKAIKLGEEEEVGVPHYDGILYIEMGLAYQALGRQDAAAKYYEKASQVAEYKVYKRKAEALLNDM